MTNPPVDSTTALREALRNNTTVEELREICHELGLDPDEFPQTKSPFIRELVAYCQRHDHYDPLLAHLRTEWPHVLRDVSAAPPAPPDAAGWHFPYPYAAMPGFTGRSAERVMLSAWRRDGPPLLVVEALGGFGKSALAWHWLTHDVQEAETPRLLWWSFYESDARFRRFLSETLRAFLPHAALPDNPREQVARLLDALRQPGTLLVLDGFERELRGYASLNAAYQGDATAGDDGGSDRDVVDPVAEWFLRQVATRPDIRARVLMTTRLLPRALEQHGQLLAGCRRVALTELPESDAIELMRGAGVRGSRSELQRVAASVGYHPLSLRLLAGAIADDAERPGDIAVAERLDVLPQLKQRQHHVLELAYDSLTPVRRRLLSQIASFRGAVAYATLRAIAEGEAAATLDDDLRALLRRGLIQREGDPARYDLHPIVRRYAYDRLSGDERSAAHHKARDYFAPIETPRRVQWLEELTPTIELYHHTVRAGQYEAAFRLYQDRLAELLYYQFSAYTHIIELLSALFPKGEKYPPFLKSKSARGWALNELAIAYSLSGNPQQAVSLFDQSNTIDRRLLYIDNLAIGLRNVAENQIKLGYFSKARTNLIHSTAISQEIHETRIEAVSYQEMGRLMSFVGSWKEAITAYDVALQLFKAKR